MNTIRFEFTMIAQLVINVITIPLVHFLETARRAEDLHEYYLCDRSTWNVYYNICRNKRKI